jgi:hypothetical protein
MIAQLISLSLSERDGGFLAANWCLLLGLTLPFASPYACGFRPIGLDVAGTSARVRESHDPISLSASPPTQQR